MESSELSERIDKVNLYVGRICKPSSILLKTKFKGDPNDCLTDTELDIIDRTTEAIKKYKSKLSMLGIGSNIRPTIVSNKVCFIICYSVVDEYDDELELVEALKYIKGFDSIKMPIECKERMILRASNHYYNLVDLVTDDNTWKSLGSDIISSLCDNNNFPYFSPFEFELHFNVRNDDIRKFGDYLYIGLRLYCLELSKKVINDEYLLKLRNDMELLFNTVLKYYIQVEDRVRCKAKSTNDFYNKVYDTQYIFGLKIIIELICSENVKTILSNRDMNEYEIKEIIDSARDTPLCNINEILSNNMVNRSFNNTGSTQCLYRIWEEILNNTPVLDNLEDSTHSIKSKVNDHYIYLIGLMDHTNRNK